MKKLNSICTIFFYIAILFIKNVFSANCSITGTDSLNFGSYNPLDANHTTSQNNITINCTGNKSVSLKLSRGNSSSFYERKLNYTLGLGLIYLKYNIYLDSSFTNIWGDGTNGTSFYSNNIRGTNVITVYGKIPAKQLAVMGTYSDSIMVTLEF